MRVAIMQPTYWARSHVWNRILTSDVFVWLDNVKFSRSAIKWDDRTVIEAPDGRPVVLRLPMKGPKEVIWSRVALNEGWRKHEKSIRYCYSRKPFWSSVEPMLPRVYGDDADTIEEVCWRTLTEMIDVLHPSCSLVRASTLGLTTSKTQMVVDIVKAVNGTSYVSGESGLSYLSPHMFRDNNIELLVQRWSPASAWRGLENPSILDVVVNYGEREAARLLADEAAVAAPS